MLEVNNEGLLSLWSFCKRNAVFWLCWLVLSGAFADTTDLYPFDDVEKTVIFQEITSQLRCLVCQNQSIADSTAPLASDLRQVVYEHIQQGEDKKVVMSYITQRYGNYVRYKPPLNKSTTVLWWGPFLFLGAIVVFFLINRKRLAKRSSAPKP